MNALNERIEGAMTTTLGAILFLAMMASLLLLGR